MGFAGPLITIGSIFLVVALIYVLVSPTGFDQVCGSCPSDSSTDASGSGGSSLTSSDTGGGGSDTAIEKQIRRIRQRQQRLRKREAKTEKNTKIEEVERKMVKNKSQTQKFQQKQKQAQMANSAESLKLEFQRKIRALQSVPDMLEHSKETATKIKEIVDQKENKQNFVSDSYGPSLWRSGDAVPEVRKEK